VRHVTPFRSVADEAESPMCIPACSVLRDSCEGADVGGFFTWWLRPTAPAASG
jgi:hypothetical protein